MEEIVRLIALASGVKLLATSDFQRGMYAEQCYGCANARDDPGNAHIACGTPCPRMSGDIHGIKNGWFMYPNLFDPVWRTADCSNYKSKIANTNAVSHAVSDAVSRAV